MILFLSVIDLLLELFFATFSQLGLQFNAVSFIQFKHIATIQFPFITKESHNLFMHVKEAYSFNELLAQMKLVFSYILKLMDLLYI